MKTHLLALLSLFCIGTALAQTPRDERIARAVERMDDGDYDEAARLLESVLAADPKNFLANYETGYLLYMQERYEEAVEPNAENNNGMDPENLYIAECYANKGPTMKRIKPRAQGRAYRIEHRMSHITLVLDER